MPSQAATFSVRSVNGIVDYVLTSDLLIFGDDVVIGQLACFKERVILARPRKGQTDGHVVGQRFGLRTRKHDDVYALTIRLLT